MSRQITRALIRYYVALRLNAGAATASWPLERPREPNPIVRLAPAQQPDGFDPRECFARADGGLAVITLPRRHARDAGTRAFSLN